MTTFVRTVPLVAVLFDAGDEDHVVEDTLRDVMNASANRAIELVDMPREAFLRIAADQYDRARDGLRRTWPKAEPTPRAQAAE